VKGKPIVAYVTKESLRSDNRNFEKGIRKVWLFNSFKESNVGEIE